MTAEEPTFTHDFVLPSVRQCPSLLSAEGLVVVLDDVHVVDDVAAQKVLRTLVDALPIGSQVAFIGRSLSAIPLAPVARPGGRVRTVELHAEDLMFSAAEETAQAFEAFGRTRRQRQEVHRGHGGGWPVAVFLLSQRPQRR